MFTHALPETQPPNLVYALYTLAGMEERAQKMPLQEDVQGQCYSPVVFGVSFLLTQQGIAALYQTNMWYQLIFNNEGGKSSGAIAGCM